jgi:hypothetical protein
LEALPARLSDDRADRLTPPRVRSAAPLVAQLLAGVADLPAARARRRAEPAQTAELYRSVGSLRPAVPRRITRTI